MTPTNLTEGIGLPAMDDFLHLIDLKDIVEPSTILEISTFRATILTFSVMAIACLALTTGSSKVSINAPIAGWSWPLFARVQFFFGAREAMMAGYSRVKGGVYKLCGGEMLVLPSKYVEELRSLPDNKASAIKAAIDNFQGVYSATDVLAESDLHFRVIQRSLTPKLNVLVPILREELAFALSQEFPDCADEWASVKGFPTILHIVSRLASRLFVGAELCRDEEWLQVSRGYTESVFRCVIFLRLFPPWLKSFVALFCAPAWRTSYYLRKARGMLDPRIKANREAAAIRMQEENGQPSKSKFDNLLQAMDDQAIDDDERRPEKLAQRTLVLTLASSHTTSMAACQALFDLCTHPEYIPELRAEITQALEEDGCWRKTTLTKLRKLDSFMKESQRFNPPSLLGFKRAIQDDLTMSDGLKLPKGAHVLMAINPIQFDDPRLQSPETFDGFRYSKMRQLPENSNRFQFATTDAYNLHFGHGAHGCPGRFLAANVIKLILVQFLTDYEFRFPVGQGRPANIAAHEYSFPNPEGLVEFRALGQRSGA